MAQPIFNLDDPTQYQGVSESPAVATDPGTVQNALLARLKAKQPSFAALNGIAIDAFPDSPENWRGITQVGNVLVRFEGSEYGGLEDAGEVVQERKLRFRIGILARGLGWSDAAGVSPRGGYAILQACLTALLGYKVQGCAKLYAKEDSFVRRDRQGGVWVYALDVIVPTWIVETADAETLPTFLEGIANNQVGASSESVNTEDQP